MGGASLRETAAMHTFEHYRYCVVVGGLGRFGLDWIGFPALVYFFRSFSMLFPSFGGWMVGGAISCRDFAAIH